MILSVYAENAVQPQPTNLCNLCMSLWIILALISVNW